MEKPSPRYSKQSSQMEEKVENFLLLHDTLTKGNYEFVTTNPYTQLVSCKLSITEFHHRTKAAFNFKFVADNCEFVLDHLKNNIDPEKSIKFLASIVVLGDIKKRDFLMLFPTLRSYYRKEEKKVGDNGKTRSTIFRGILLIILWVCQKRRYLDKIIYYKVFTFPIDSLSLFI